MSNSNGRRDARRKKGKGAIEAGGKKKEFEDFVEGTNASIEEKGNDNTNKSESVEDLFEGERIKKPFQK